MPWEALRDSGELEKPWEALRSPGKLWETLESALWGALGSPGEPQVSEIEFGGPWSLGGEALRKDGAGLQRMVQDYRVQRQKGLRLRVSPVYSPIGLRCYTPSGVDSPC